MSKPEREARMYALRALKDAGRIGPMTSEQTDALLVRVGQLLRAADDKARP